MIPTNLQLTMSHMKDRRLWLILLLICTIGLVGMALSVAGFDESGLLLEGISLLFAVAGVAMTALDVFRSSESGRKSSTTRHP